MKSWVVEPPPSSVWEGLVEGRNPARKPVEVHVGSFSRYFFKDFFAQMVQDVFHQQYRNQKSESNDTSNYCGLSFLIALVVFRY